MKSRNGSQVELTWQDSSLTLYSFPERCCHPLNGPRRNKEANTPHWEVTSGGCVCVCVCFRMMSGAMLRTRALVCPRPRFLPHKLLLTVPCPAPSCSPKSPSAASTDTSASLFPTNCEFVSPTLPAEALSPPVTHRCSGGRGKDAPEEAVDEEPRAGALLFCSGCVMHGPSILLLSQPGGG